MQTKIVIAPNLTLNDHWRKAIDLWLETRKTPTTRRAYAKALEDALLVTGRLPWEMTRTDMHQWIQEMQQRGLSPATVAQRLAGMSSFFRFCNQDFLVNGEPLFNGNPAEGRSLRPKIQLYGKAAYLDAEESRALLRAIYRAGIAGKRDFALFLGYLLLARRNSEWRTARWGDFEQRGGLVFFRWSGKGKKDQRLEVPTPVWAAIAAFLQADGRAKTIQAGDYIFTAISQRGRAMPRGGEVQGTRPISSHEVGRLLKRYLRVAGIEPRRICVHSLRHSGAMLRHTAGDSIEEIMTYLGHANLAITQVYLHALEGKTDRSWMKVSELLGLDFEDFDR